MIMPFIQVGTYDVLILVAKQFTSPLQADFMRFVGVMDLMRLKRLDEVKPKRAFFLVVLFLIHEHLFISELVVSCTIHTRYQEAVIGFLFVNDVFEGAVQCSSDCNLFY